MSDFVNGVRLLGRGFALYGRNPRLLVLGLIPAVITGLIFIAAFVVLLYFLGDLVGAATGFADEWSSGARNTVRFAAGVAIVGVTGFLWIVSFTAVTLVIGDPFYETISERIEDRLGGVPGDVSVPWWRSLGRSIRDSARLLLLSVAIGIPLFVAGFVPVVGQTVVPVAGAAVGGWFLALELVGVPFGRRGLGLAARRAALRAHRPLALGFGMAVFLCFLVPLGAVIVMPAAVAGGTLLARQALGLSTTE